VAASCRSLTTYRAALSLTGQVGAQRIRGLASARLSAAVTADGRLGLEASVSGQSVFRLGGDRERAVLLLRDPTRVVESAPADLLNALIGLNVGPDRLRAIFGGCVSELDEVVRGVRHDRMLEVTTPDATVYIESGDGGWHARFGRVDDLLVEYARLANGFPREIRVRSVPGRTPAVALTMRVLDLQANGDVDASAFRVVIPVTAERISVAALREAGPIGSDGAPR
jgi:hypothetical protein